jgi:adenylate cyclase
MLSPKTRKDLTTLVAFVAIGTLVGVGFSTIPYGGFSLIGVGLGASLGLVISLLCAVGNYFILPRFSRLPFTAYLVVKTAYFTMVVLLVLAFRQYGLTAWMDLSPLSPAFLLTAVGITLLIAIAANFVFLLRRMLGQGVLSSFFSGRYHRPVEEERIFMFLDIVSSTTIAEKIGHVKFHMLLNDFFFHISDAILEARGEIYKYVGDEVIVDWTMDEGLEDARCVRSYFLVLESIESRREYYERTYGFVPGFRAGVHGGRVVVGEMGDHKREIAFLGDVVNTTARIQGATKEHGEDLLVSSTIMDRIELPAGFEAREIGSIQLRGKEEAVGLVGIHRT